MKIKITGVNDPLILKEIAVINNGFFTEWEFVNHQSKADFEYKLTLKADPNKNSKDLKYDYLKTYLQFLLQKFEKAQPWGLLNNMRPNKLVHSMKKRRIPDNSIINELQNTYLIQQQKMDLLINIANQQLKAIPDLYNLEQEVSVYIGIPFCPSRCAYCTFAAYPYEPNKKWIAPFLKSLLAEINIIGQHLKVKKTKITSIYLGGGTPTILNIAELRSLLSAIYENIATPSEVREITVEAGRPDTLSKEKLQLLKDFSVNRLSINPQSFNETTLSQIGRHHTVADILAKFKLSKDVGIENVNMDLIVGLPGEGKAELARSLDYVKDLQPESLTVHMLAFKRKSEISNERHVYTVVAEEVLKDMAKMTYDFTELEGYTPYYLYRQKNIAGNLENIGYAKLGKECIYNVLMMEEAQNVLGLGVGASSKFLVGESVHNPRDLRTYIENYEVYAKKKLELLELCMKTRAKSFTYNQTVL